MLRDASDEPLAVLSASIKNGPGRDIPRIRPSAYDARFLRTTDLSKGSKIMTVSDPYSYVKHGLLHNGQELRGEWQHLFWHFWIKSLSFTRFITPKRVTSWRCPASRYCANWLHRVLRRNVVQISRPEIWTLSLYCCKEERFDSETNAFLLDQQVIFCALFFYSAISLFIRFVALWYTSILSAFSRSAVALDD